MDEVRKIHQELRNGTKTFQQLAEEYGCSACTISRINKGQLKNYRLEDFTYPLRAKPHSTAKQAYWDELNK